MSRNDMARAILGGTTTGRGRGDACHEGKDSLLATGGATALEVIRAAEGAEFIDDESNPTPLPFRVLLREARSWGYLFLVESMDRSHGRIVAIVRRACGLTWCVDCKSESCDHAAVVRLAEARCGQ